MVCCKCTQNYKAHVLRRNNKFLLLYLINCDTNYQPINRIKNVCAELCLAHTAHHINGCPRRDIWLNVDKSQTVAFKLFRSNSAQFPSVGTLKDRVCVNNTLKDNIQRETASILRQLQCVSKNIVNVCETCLKAGSQHLSTVLWNKVSWGAEKYGYKLLMYANFVCDEAPITATMLKVQIKGQFCSILHLMMKIFSR
jgi:hypothetical protein